jgi:hypothetical protein
MTPEQFIRRWQTSTLGEPQGKQLIVIARDDDTTFGILHSRFHRLWSLRVGTSLEDRRRHMPTTTFETFPFPEGLTPNLPASTWADDPRAQAIAQESAPRRRRSGVDCQVAMRSDTS